MKKLKIAVLTAAMTVVMATASMAADKVTAITNANLYQKASSSSEVVMVMPEGTTRTILKTSSSGNWYKVKVNGVSGYVKKKYVAIVGEEQASDTSDAANSNSSGSSTSTTFRNNVCKMAESLLGKPYVYGATGPNAFDCSGFCQYIYGKCGKTIPRVSADQYAKSTKIAKSSLKKGDLVFFASSAGGTKVSHVGIYVGDGKMIHAANSSVGVITSDLDSTYYSTHYVGAGRY
ncbi:MAG: C40 family peptidase [Butyricicoccus sp.]